MTFRVVPFCSQKNLRFDGAEHEILTGSIADRELANAHIEIQIFYVLKMLFLSFGHLYLIAGDKRMFLRIIAHRKVADSSSHGVSGQAEHNSRSRKPPDKIREIFVNLFMPLLLLFYEKSFYKAI